MLWWDLKKKLRCRKGYILMEVMLAVIIFGFIIVGATRSFQQTVEANKTTSRQSILRDRLKSQLALLRVEKNLQEGEETTDPDFDGIYYEKKIETIELQNQDGENLDGLYKVEIRAIWPLSKYKFEEATAELVLYQ